MSTENGLDAFHEGCVCQNKYRTGWYNGFNVCQLQEPYKSRRSLVLFCHMINFMHLAKYIYSELAYMTEA